MKYYLFLKSALYNKIVLSLLKRHILSLDEAYGCLIDIDKLTKCSNDLHKEFIMVKQKGLSNIITTKSDLEAINND